MRREIHQFSLLFFLIFWGYFQSISAQEDGIYTDTLLVSGPNEEDLSKYLVFWIDSTSHSTIDKVAGSLKNGQFKHWNINTPLNLGNNPYPVWLYLNVKNVSPNSQKYWWSLYSHADTINVFEKAPKGWRSVDTVAYGTPLLDRKVKVRFSATEILLQGHESKELLLKVKNYRHTQNAITDFTTPEHNLLWENKFYWSTSFFVGCFLLISAISFFISIVLKEKVFFLYGNYLLLVLSMSLMEELMVPVISNPLLFYLLKRSHSLPLAIMALGIHYHIIMYIFGNKEKQGRILKVLTKINNVALVYGAIYLLTYLLFMEKLHHGHWPYNIMWHTGVGMIFLIMLITFIMIFIEMNKKKLPLPGIALAFLILYFNPAGYFLNYSGIVNYYKITHPNYFYWIVCVEFIAIGCVLAWRYRKKERDHYLLLEEKALQEEKAFSKELEIQEQERKQIARDLHDDLGTTLSAIKLIVTNSYLNDKPLVNMITKANTDLRHFFNKLSLSSLNEYGIFHILREKVGELNRVGKTQFTFIEVGEESLFPDFLKVPITRISVELLSNVLKHSAASEATLQLIIDPSQVQLIVEDNGKGFNLKVKKKGMGINNIYDRVKRWDGEIHFSSATTGTTAIITLPFVNKP